MVIVEELGTMNFEEYWLQYLKETGGTKSGDEVKIEIPCKESKEICFFRLRPLYSAYSERLNNSIQVTFFPV